jgi:peptide/nickel transport system ATP-binding protein
MSRLMAQSPVLEVDGLRVELPASSDRAFAVEDVGFTVAAGEVMCLVGESGSGKSVIAQTVMGLLPKPLEAVSGRVLVTGEDVRTSSAARLRALRCTRMSMIFQEPMTALNPVMTCGAQIDEVLRTHTDLSQAARWRRIRDILGDVGLADVNRIAKSYPHQLSGGQRQRIMIAMALILKPPLLIADEPTTALDVTTQAQILSLIRTLQQERGMGVLFITHDFGVVAEIADRVGVLRSGRMVECDTADRVLNSPCHEYTKMLIGAVPSLTPRHRAPPEAREIILRTDALTKTYRGRGWLFGSAPVAAVQGVTLDIRRGETLGIVGESGSGKSTVARCIARLIDPTSGSIVISGTEIGKLSIKAMQPFRRQVQIVFQDPYRSLNPRRTVGVSLIEGPMNFGISRAEAWSRARELVRMVRLDPSTLDRFPHEFSGGQRQRICIARALAMEPDLLVADEAVSALDVSVQKQVLALLEEIRARLNLAMLFITHDLRVAAQVCDRVAVMWKGSVVECGPVTEVFADPRHEYTKALFSAAPGRQSRFLSQEAAGDGD